MHDPHTQFKFTALLYTLFSTKLAGPFTLHIFPPTKQFIRPSVFVIASMRHAHLTRVQCMRQVMLRKCTLTRTGLLLHMDKYEPHNFHQFSTEQSIDYT